MDEATSCCSLKQLEFASQLVARLVAQAPASTDGDPFAHFTLALVVCEKAISKQPLKV